MQPEVLDLFDTMLDGYLKIARQLAAERAERGEPQTELDKLSEKLGWPTSADMLMSHKAELIRQVIPSLLEDKVAFNKFVENWSEEFPKRAQFELNMLLTKLWKLPPLRARATVEEKDARKRVPEIEAKLREFFDAMEVECKNGDWRMAINNYHLMKKYEHDIEVLFDLEELQRGRKNVAATSKGGRDKQKKIAENNKIDGKQTLYERNAEISLFVECLILQGNKPMTAYRQAAKKWKHEWGLPGQVKSMNVRTIMRIYAEAHRQKK
ncbi:MAG: hypothetical protein WCH84_02665 [Verrucomicrobiota bacterium]